MFDSKQNNDVVYYGTYQQQQRTNENQLRDVQAQHGEMKQLETDIVQLHGIHRDFADLVSNQNSVIDNIESDVIKTEFQVVTGVNALGKTLEIQSAVRRKKLLCGLFIFIIIAIAITIGVVIYLTKK